MLCLHSKVNYGQSKKFEGKKLLIYTKNGKGYVHKNIPASVATLQKICESIGVESVVSEDLYELSWFQKHLQGGIEYLLED
jgi:hypothetical protein|tara:strand:- start:2750 stop:2992 length:243 start_codon:yes stop_codon:yes gene_type:complete